MSTSQKARGSEAAAQDPTPDAYTGRRLILVDGFNVLHAVLLGKDRDSGWWQRVHRERLLERVTHWSEAGDAIWVVFDGSRPAMSVWAEPVARSNDDDSSGPVVHSLFVESADNWIVRRARRTQHPERMIVVSADRKVAGRARSAGCEILTPWAFMARCTRAEEGAAEVSGSSVSAESSESSISSEACDISSSVSA